MRLGRAIRILAVAALAACLIAACVSKPADQGDPVAPILVRGQVLDAGGRAVPSSALNLQVWDTANAKVGQPVPLLYSHDFTAQADGWFELHVAVEPALSNAGATNNGFVNFMIQAIGGGVPVSQFSFDRQIVGGTWDGAAPMIQLKPGGSTEIEPPAPEVTVPPPAPS